MPIRRYDRSQAFLIPPTLDEQVPPLHPVRFVVDLLESFPDAWWQEAGIDLDGAATGAPNYDQKVLFMVWVFGFMDRKRSSRELEQACRRDVSYWWLTGRQCPDHNTLARFYQRHKPAIRSLFKTTVRVAMEHGLVSWAVQAIDGTKIVADAAPDQAISASKLRALLDQVDVAIAELESRLTGEAESAAVAMPAELADIQARRAKIEAALARLDGEKADQTVNWTDPDATIMKTRRGLQPSYNGQAVAGVAPMPDGQPNGRIVLGGSLTQDANDQQHLIEQITNARELTGEVAEAVLADAGYTTHEAIATAEALGQVVVAPEQTYGAKQGKRSPASLGIDDFTYDLPTDTFICPMHQRLTFRYESTEDSSGVRRRLYRTDPSDCRGCPLAERCLGPVERSRRIRTPAGIAAMERHRRWMAQPDAQRLGARRKHLIEPVFGILKQTLRMGRAFRRGFANVESEWFLGLSALNLRTLARCWANGQLVLN